MFGPVYSQCILLRLSPLTSYFNDKCIQLWCQTSGGLLRLGKKKAKTLDMHMHFCGISHATFITFITLFFVLSTWGVISQRTSLPLSKIMDHQGNYYAN